VSVTKPLNIFFNSIWETFTKFCLEIPTFSLIDSQ
jgi:hypothetical protein